jgi:tRNA A37 threonylcarbamoyladenosine dehydratase
LARALRNRFKKQQRFPKRKFKCVFSDEPAQQVGEVKGSLVQITAVFGMTLASLVIQESY